MYSAKVLRVEPLLEFIESNLNKIGRLVRVYFDVVIRANQAGDFLNSDVNDPSASVAHEQPKKMFGWAVLSRTGSPFAY